MEQSVNELDLKELTQFAMNTIQDMGRAALKYYGQSSQQAPFDQDLVTQAEVDLGNGFQKQIESRFPMHQVYGQAPLDDAYSHGEKRFLWVFDPLDGVDNFQIGIPIWGMSLALYENHWPVFGLFFMPVTQDLFFAKAGDQALWNNRPIAVSDRGAFSQESLLLTYSRFNQHYQSRFPGKIRNYGSTGAHACYVAMGRADAAILTSETFKDLAAVRVIVTSAGGTILKSDGTDFYIGAYIDGSRVKDHVMITNPAGVASLQACLKSL